MSDLVLVCPSTVYPCLNRVLRRTSPLAPTYLSSGKTDPWHPQETTPFVKLKATSPTLLKDLYLHFQFIQEPYSVNFFFPVDYVSLLKFHCLCVHSKLRPYPTPLYCKCPRKPRSDIPYFTDRYHKLYRRHLVPHTHTHTHTRARAHTNIGTNTWLTLLFSLPLRRGLYILKVETHRRQTLRHSGDISLLVLRLPQCSHSFRDCFMSGSRKFWLCPFRYGDSSPVVPDPDGVTGDSEEKGSLSVSVLKSGIGPVWVPLLRVKGIVRYHIDLSQTR